MRDSPLWASFTLATLALWLQKDLLPDCTLSLYVPFWVHLAFHTNSKLRALWFSSLSALLIDLLSSHSFGIHATSAALTMYLLYPMRSYLFHERPLHFALYTLAISFTFSSLEALFLFLFDTRLQDAGKWLLSDLWGMPFIDALYAVAWFWLPLSLMRHLYKGWQRFWIQRKDNSLASR